MTKWKPVVPRHSNVTITLMMMVVVMMMMMTTVFNVGAEASPIAVDALTSLQGSSDDSDAEDTDRLRNKRETFDMLDFLSNYGYLAPPEATYEGKFQSDEVINIAIRDFQRFNGLKVTGIPDKETVELMKKPRCGMPDIIRDPYSDHKGNNNNKNVNIPMAFTTFGTRWNKDTVTWKTSKFSKKLTKGQTWRALQKAFDVWEREIPLKFSYSESKPDIEILFAEGDHGDGYRNRFQGKGGVLAHAYRPGRGIGGDTHFDDSEEWLVDESDQNKIGTDLVTVAAHEFGHALGLGHSNVRAALMAPYYRKFEKLELHEDDIQGITEIYGRKLPETTTTTSTTTTTTTTKRPSTTTTTTTPSTTAATTHTTTSTNTTTAIKVAPRTDNPWIPPFCSRSFRLDAISAGPDRRWFAYRREYIYEVGPRGLAFGFPKRIREVFPGAPVKNVRAVTYVPETRRTYIFKYSYVWRFTDFSLDEGYPRIWTTDYRFRPSAALTLTYNGYSQIFMFGHDNFWEFNIRTEKIAPGYPLSLTTYFPYAPMLPDAALATSRGNFVFFKYNRFKNLPTRGKNARSQPIGPNVFGTICGQRPAENLWGDQEEDRVIGYDEEPEFESATTSSEDWGSSIESPPLIKVHVRDGDATGNAVGNRGRWHQQSRGHRRGHRRNNVNWRLGQRSNYRSRTSYRRY